MLIRKFGMCSRDIKLYVMIVTMTVFYGINGMANTRWIPHIDAMVTKIGSLPYI